MLDPMRLKAKLSLPICALLAGSLFAQHATDPANRYFRLIAVVHLTGSGKAGDPFQPEYVPSAAVPDRHAILAWS